MAAQAAVPHRRQLRSFTADAGGTFVFAEAFETRLPQQVVLRPFGVGELTRELGLDVVDSIARRGDVAGEWGVVDAECVEPGAEVQQHLAVESGADLAG